MGEVPSSKRSPGSLSARIRRRIEALGPYQSLLLLSVPTCLVEPSKLITLAVVGDGHWITGTVMIIAAYAISLTLVERLFRIVKPKLLTLLWFSLRSEIAKFGSTGIDHEQMQIFIAVLVIEKHDVAAVRAPGLPVDGAALGARDRLTRRHAVTWGHPDVQHAINRSQPRQ
jgi:hypothetical protein